MIKKEYFTTQEVPAWVKARVMQKISASPKKFRLLYVMKYKVMIPLFLFVMVLTWGYLSFSNKNTGGGSSLVVNTQKSELVTGSKVVENSDTLSQEDVQIVLEETSDDVLQQKLAEAENILNDLSLYSNQEEDITL